MKYLLKEIEKIPQAENDTFCRAAQDAYQQSGLASKGVVIRHVDKNNVVNETNSLLQRLRQIKTLKKSLKPKIFRTKRLNLGNTASRTKNMKNFDDINAKLDANQAKKYLEHLQTIAAGKNACFVHKTKDVFVNNNKMAFSTFHELGHSVNCTSTGFKKFLSKSRHIFALGAPLLLAAGLIIKKKPETDKNGKKEHSFGQFIKKNCGWPATLCMLPTVAEEGLASINGAKLAKGVLSPEMYKKLNKLNAKAFGSYAIGAVLAGVCTQLAVYVKDKVMQPSK